MVLTVTLNPMLDKTLFLPKYELGKIWRSKKIENTTGGKGINVSLQLWKFGIDTIMTGFLGGEIGRSIKNILDNDGLENDFIEIEDDTRIGFTVLDESTMIQTSVFEPNPKIKINEINELLIRILFYSTKAKWIVFSGSVPQEELNGFYLDVISNTKRSNPQIIIALDSYGKAFSNCLCEELFISKQNKIECENTFNIKLNTEKDFIEALDRFSSELSIITDSQNSVYFAFSGKNYKIKPPKIKLINPIGSGDSMLAGIIYAIEKDYKICDAMRFGVACGATNAENWAIAKCDLESVNKKFKSITVEEL